MVSVSIGASARDLVAIEALTTSRIQSLDLTLFVLGVAFAVLTFFIKGPVGYFAGTLSAWLRARPAALAGIYRASAAVLIGLAVRLALEARG